MPTSTIVPMLLKYFLLHGDFRQLRIARIQRRYFSGRWGKATLMGDYNC